MQDKRYHVYIITNRYNTVLYTGITSDLKIRIWDHKNKQNNGFSARYNLNKLVFYETFRDPLAAINREKQIKAGSRAKKVYLIMEMNPGWIDLYDGL